MLRPTKHSHPDRTVLYASTLILTRLKKKRLANYTELLQLVRQQIAKGGDTLFVPALDLLFLLGLLKYHPKTDAFEYTGAN